MLFVFDKEGGAVAPGDRMESLNAERLQFSELGIEIRQFPT
jgi:hypothetical protein